MRSWSSGDLVVTRRMFIKSALYVQINYSLMEIKLKKNHTHQKQYIFEQNEFFLFLIQQGKYTFNWKYTKICNREICNHWMSNWWMRFVVVVRPALGQFEKLSLNYIGIERKTAQYLIHKWKILAYIEMKYGSNKIGWAYKNSTSKEMSCIDQMFWLSIRQRPNENGHAFSRIIIINAHTSFTDWNWPRQLIRPAVVHQAAIDCQT